MRFVNIHHKYDQIWKIIDSKTHGYLGKMEMIQTLKVEERFPMPISDDSRCFLSSVSSLGILSKPFVLNCFFSFYNVQNFHTIYGAWYLLVTRVKLEYGKICFVKYVLLFLVIFFVKAVWPVFIFIRYRLLK